MKWAVIAAGYGAAQPQVMARDMAPLEQALRQAVPQAAFYTVYTSGALRLQKAREGVLLPDLSAVLRQALADGCTAAAIQPTYLLSGLHYTQLCSQARAFQKRFKRLCIGQPLLAGPAEITRMAQVLATLWPATPGRMIVAVGHGTQNVAGSAYRMLQQVLETMGRPDIRVGALENGPDVQQVLAAIAPGTEHIVLVPLVAAVSNYTSDALDFWQQQLHRTGITCDRICGGVGMLAPVRALYVQHLQTCMEQGETV